MLKDKILIFAVISCLIGGGFIAAHLYNSGYDKAKVEIVKQLQKNKDTNQKLKSKTDEEIESLSVSDLCIVLGGLPDDCNK